MVRQSHFFPLFYHSSKNLFYMQVLEREIQIATQEQQFYTNITFSYPLVGCMPQLWSCPSHHLGHRGTASKTCNDRGRDNRSSGRRWTFWTWFNTEGCGGELTRTMYHYDNGARERPLHGFGMLSARRTLALQHLCGFLGGLTTDDPILSDKISTSFF